MTEDILDLTGADRRHAKLLTPITRTTRSFYPFFALLLVLVSWGIYGYSFQLTSGLSVTGLRNTVFWGVYIVNFVFFIGIAHVGALVSAILRLSKVPWSKPVTRIAELVTFAALPVAASMPLIDLGRVDRVLNILFFGRIQSPILWDFVAISTYFIGSLLFIYVPMIPDIKILQDSGEVNSRWRKIVYRIFSIGWRGSPGQWSRLRKSIFALAVIILPVVFMVHTVVSYMFAMNLVPGWNSTIFGPYFVLGAVMSGVATLIMVMWFARSLFHWQEYLKPIHFKGLGIMLMMLTLGYLYFSMNEYLVVGYTMPLDEKALLSSLFFGDYSFLFGFQFLLLIVAVVILAVPRTRTITGIFVASMMIFASAWIKRFVIVVPALTNPRFPREFIVYTPSIVEVAITVAAFATFILIMTIFAKLFPIVPIWEVEEGLREEGKAHSKLQPEGGV